ncbi:MAG: hypothetical protein IPO09_16690 [Anaeromyxobacter sp.]|nr:hypothetical protein [Anaeromyxobacter sp.]
MALSYKPKGIQAADSRLEVAGHPTPSQAGLVKPGSMQAPKAPHQPPIHQTGIYRFFVCVTWRS